MGMITWTQQARLRIRVELDGEGGRPPVGRRWRAASPPVPMARVLGEEGGEEREEARGLRVVEEEAELRLFVADAQVQPAHECRAGGLLDVVEDEQARASDVQPRRPRRARRQEECRRSGAKQC